jgi:hypothetical protein
MTDCIQFKDLIVNNYNPAVNQEESIEHFLAFAGLHDHSSKDTYGTDALVALMTEGTWTTNVDHITGTGGGSAQWYRVIFDKIVELGFTAEFDVPLVTGISAFLFMENDDHAGYAFAWGNGNVALQRIASNGTITNLHVLPYDIPIAMHVKIAVRPMRLLAVDQIDQIAISVWFDESLVMSHVLFWDGTTMSGQYVGFALYGNGVGDFDNFRIPQLHQIVDYSSVDPGEPASAGMGRVIANERIRIHARWNGTVLIWRSDDSDVDWVVDDGRPHTVRSTRQIYWPNHVRVVGAIHEVDRHRHGEQGHVFALAQDPNALDAKATYTRAGYIHRDLEERAENVVFQMAPNPALEPEDIIEYNGTLYRVTSINYRIQWRGGQESGAPVLESTVTCRRCLE